MPTVPAMRAGERTQIQRGDRQIQDMWFTSFMHFFNSIMISKLIKLHFWLHVHDSTHSVYFRKTWIVRQYCCIVLDFIINNNNNNNNRCYFLNQYYNEYNICIVKYGTIHLYNITNTYNNNNNNLYIFFINIIINITFVQWNMILDGKSWPNG